MGKRENPSGLDFSQEDLSDLERDLENRLEEDSGEPAQPGQPRVVMVTRDKVVGVTVPPVPAVEDDDGLDGATVIMKRPVFSTDPEPAAPAPEAATPDPRTDTAPDWAKVNGDAEQGKTIEMPVPNTLHGPAAVGPGDDGWVNPAPVPLEDDGMATQQDKEVPAPGAAPSGDSSSPQANPPNRMAVLMAALGKSGEAARKKAGIRSTLGRASVRHIRPAHSEPPAMRRERSNPGVPVTGAVKAEADQADELRPTSPFKITRTPATPVPQVEPEEAATALAEDEDDKTIPPPMSISPHELVGADHKAGETSPLPMIIEEPASSAMAEGEMTPLPLTVEEPVEAEMAEGEMTPLPLTVEEPVEADMAEGETAPLPRVVEQPTPHAPVVAEPTPLPPPVDASQPQTTFAPDQPSPFARVAQEEESAEMEVDIDLDMDEEDDDIPFFTGEAARVSPPSAAQTQAQAGALEEDVTPPPIPEAELSPFTQPDEAEDDGILTSAPPLGQDPAPPPSEDAAPEASEELEPEQAEELDLEAEHDHAEELDLEAEHDHAEELDLEDMEEASLEELEEEPSAPVAEPVSSEPPPPLMPDAPAPQARPMTPARNRPWYYDLFDQDWLKTNPSPPLEETEKEVQFILESLGVTQQSRILELGVGDGRHLLEVARRGFSITSYEMSLPLLLRAAEISHRFNIKAKYIQGDYRDLGMDERFDAAYCVGTRFGFHDEESNERIVSSVCRALRPGGRFLLDVLNRDYLLKDLPARIWRDGEDCLVLEEVEFDYFTSRLISRRTVAFEDGRHTENEISVRVFSLHEIGKLLHRSGFRVLEVSGHSEHRGYFFGNQSTSMVLLAEKRS